MPRLKTCDLCDGIFVPCGSLRVCSGCGNNHLRPITKQLERAEALERCRQAGNEYSIGEACLAELRKQRNSVIREAHTMGFGYRRIAAAMGISISRVQQIINGEQ